MASRGNLIPTTVVDKNGRRTTVHKKAPGTSKVASLPPVAALTSTVSEKERRNSLTETLLSAWPAYDSDSLKGSNARAFLRDCSMESLEGLEHTRVNHPGTFTKMGYMASDGYSEAEVREAMYFYPQMRGSSYFTARRIMASLHEYRELPYTQDLSSEDEAVRAQCTALIRVIESLIDGDHEDAFHDRQPPFMIRDLGLVEFTVEHPDRADLIAGFVRDRGAADVNVLTELLESESPSLGSGLL